MLGYICKYAPVEIFQSMGAKTERIEPDVTSFNQAETIMRCDSDSGKKLIKSMVLRTADRQGMC